MRLLAVSTILLLALLLFGCLEKKVVANNMSTDSDSVEFVMLETTSYENDHDVAINQTMKQAASGIFIALEQAVRDAASRIVATMDDKQLAAQVIITGIDGKGHLTQGMKTLLMECPAGGIMLFRYNLDTDNEAIQELIAETVALIALGNTLEMDQTVFTIPPFVAVDHEGGSVNRFRTGVADLPPAAFYSQMAQDKGEEAAIVQINTDSFNAGTSIKRLGVNMNLAPITEYLNDNNRDFLSNRSYGSDPAFTAKAASAFVAGMEQAGILCVVKHFPGSAGADPHYYLSVLNGSKPILAELTAPTAALINNGYARVLMVSHTVVPAWDSKIASLSPAVMGTWLRGELGYKGIIICDDFSMAAAKISSSTEGASSLSPETAAVLSLAAGTDMVLVWPQDLLRTHRVIMAALDDGSLPRERLTEAATRVIYEKILMELIIGEWGVGSGEWEH
jgi:beta-N-acetylhexosaminidase